MVHVENYLRINSNDISKALEDKKFITFQGHNILFEVDSYKENEVKEFLDSIFGIVNKIAIESKEGKYYIISCKFKDESVIEPFKEFQNISERFNNDTSKMASFIGQKE